VRLVEKAYEYIARTDKLKENFDAAIAEENVEKASEFLWGILACYLNALKILIDGKPAKKHGELRDLGLSLAKGLGDERLYRAIKKAEKLHANFYHAFLDIEDFREIYNEVMYAVTRVYEEIVSRVKISR
jgi:hypothetical protein